VAHNIEEIELLALVGEKLRDLSTVLLHDMLVKLGPCTLVDKVLIHID
jgi:hypothetical protein